MLMHTSRHVRFVGCPSLPCFQSVAGAIFDSNWSTNMPKGLLGSVSNPRSIDLRTLVEIPSLELREAVLSAISLAISVGSPHELVRLMLNVTCRGYGLSVPLHWELHSLYVSNRRTRLTPTHHIFASTTALRLSPHTTSCVSYSYCVTHHQISQI